MRIFCLSLNHTCTPIEVREQVAFDRPQGMEFLLELCRPDAAEGLLLSTCNRTEVYVALPAVDTSSPLMRVLELLERHRNFNPRQSPANHWRAEGPLAVTHLFRVAAGLESQILGESQVLGQIKSALDWSQEAGTCGRVIGKFGERALRVGKRVRSETAIGDGALSHAYAALELAKKIFGGLSKKRVLVIGVGESASLALENLSGVDTSGVTVMNRTLSHAQKLADEIGASARPLEELEAAMIDADLVFSSTGAQEPVISYDLVRRVRNGRGARRPILLFDLGLPRDIAPRTAEIDGVYLKNLDDLASVVQANTRQRLDEVPRAESIVGDGVSTFLDWVAALTVEPAIRDLRKAFEQVRGEELAQIRGNLDAETFELLDETTRRLVARLLHLPSANLKREDALRDPEILALIRRLFLEELPHPAAESERVSNQPGSQEGH